MEKLALYRKYRPRTFSDVVGQNSVVSSLKAQVAEGRISHAYLFTGTRGTGKTTCAKILARAICCLDPHDGEPCNQCEACLAAMSGAMDITEIDAASNNGVDNIRELRQEAVYAPSQLKYRVYIIDEVHMLSQGAFNALLKTLEEPPSHVVFILATTELHKVPATILSRCQRYDFRRIPAEIMAAALEDIAGKEGFLLDHDAADILAAMGDGSMRDSVSLLDRARGGAFHVTADSVTEALGLATEREILDIFNAVLKGDAAGAVTAFTNCYMTGRDIISVFDNLLSLLRDIYLYKATASTDQLLSRWRRRVPDLAAGCSEEWLERCIEAINFFLSRTTRTSAKRLDGEMCLIKMSLPERAAAAPTPVKSAPAPAPKQAVKADTVTEAAPAVSRAEDDGPPPWDEDDAPPVADEAPSVNAEPPERKEYAQTAAPNERYDAVRAALDGKVNSAVKVYLKSADVREDNGGLYIAVAEEGLIFINKPDVAGLIDEAAKAQGYRFGKVEAKKAVVKEDPLEKIRSRAESLGVNIRIK